MPPDFMKGQNMKQVHLLINYFTMTGGNHYTIVPTDIHPDKVEEARAVLEIGGAKLITVSEEKAQEILKRQADAVKLQIELSRAHIGEYTF